jgi:hypothetical protein
LRILASSAASRWEDAGKIPTFFEDEKIYNSFFLRISLSSYLLRNHYEVALQWILYLPDDVVISPAILDG